MKGLKTVDAAVAAYKAAAAGKKAAAEHPNWGALAGHNRPVDGVSQCRGIPYRGR